MSVNEIEEVKARTDLVDLISSYVTLKKAGANYKGVCPFHQEKTASLMVSPQKQIWKCFGCDKGGDAFKFVMEMEHLEFGDALRLLAQKAGVTLQPRTKAEHQTQNRKEILYRVNNLASLVWQKILWESPGAKPVREYLKQRQVTEQTAKHFRLGFAPKGFNLSQVMAARGVTAGDLRTAGNPERFFDRLIFPIFDVLGNVIAFTGRTLGDGQPKYLNSPETPLFNKSRVLYGLNLAKAGIKERNYVVLVEGQMDVIALHQAGATNAVASSGTAITETQLLILSKYTDNFLLAFDSDSAGVNTTKKVIELLVKNDLNAKVVDFQPFKDAGELLAEQPQEWPARVKAASEALEWLLTQEIRRIGSPQFVENKKALIKALLPVLSLVAEPTRLDYYVQRLARQLEVKPESVYASLAKIQAKAPGFAAAPVRSAPTAPGLTPEEQLLALVLYRPSLLESHQAAFDQVVWQSAQASRIAEAIRNCYTKKTLVKNQAQFLSSVKTFVNSPLDDKLDSWLFWLSTTWPELTDKQAGDLISEKLGQLATKSYERDKERLALLIRTAQEQGKTAEVKKLMKQLSELTAKGK